MNTLSDRYIAEAVARAPYGQKDEVEREVRAAVNDMIETRLASGEDAAVAERHALQELGDPKLLARQFATGAESLIGPDWFPSWKSLVLKVVPTLALVIGTIVAAVAVMSTEQDALEGITTGLAKGLGAGLDIAIQALFWITVVYAILERTSKPDRAVSTDDTPWSISDLPAIAMKPQITLSSTISDLVGLGALGAMAWMFTQTGAFREVPDGEISNQVPLLNPNLDGKWVMIFLLLLALSVSMVFSRYLMQYWTSGALMTQVIESLAWIVGIGVLAFKAQLINPELPKTFAELKGNWWAVGDSASQMLFLITIIIAVAELIAAWRGHRAYRNANPA